MNGNIPSNDAESFRVKMKGSWPHHNTDIFSPLLHLRSTLEFVKQTLFINKPITTKYSFLLLTIISVQPHCSSDAVRQLLDDKIEKPKLNKQVKIIPQFSASVLTVSGSLFINDALMKLLRHSFLPVPVDKLTVTKVFLCFYHSFNSRNRGSMIAYPLLDARSQESVEACWVCCDS